MKCRINMSFKKNKTKFILISFTILLFFIALYYVTPIVFSMFFHNNIEYNIDKDISSNNLLENKENDQSKNDLDQPKEDKENIIVSHIKTPENVKAIYMSGWVAGSEKFRDSLVKIIDETEINSVVIDVKDSTGRISFSTDDLSIQKIGSSENRIKDIKMLTNLLHSKNIYIIGRISVFQDPYLTKLKPEWAIKRLSDGGVWKDRKGLSFLDPTNKNVHEYTLAVAKQSYEYGFDEINFDYIRYPSDGNMKDINYNLSNGKTKADNIEEFFKYINTELKKDENIPISGDLFGLTTESKDDMGIGQVWEKALPYFDFLCPMVYPSHYPSGHDGYKNPAMYPYEIVDKALASAVVRTNAMGQNLAKIRPWLQDFDIGATYTKEMVRAQIKAVYANKLTSWMLWDPSNKYTPTALEIEKNN